MKNSVLETFAAHNSVMCQMPTGTSKTYVLALVVGEYAKGKRVWVVAHCRELIEQIKRTWTEFYKGRKDAPEVRVSGSRGIGTSWRIRVPQ